MLFSVKNGFKVDPYLPDLMKRTQYASFTDVFFKMIPFITTDITKVISGVSILDFLFYNILKIHVSSAHLELVTCKNIITYVCFNKSKSHKYEILFLLDKCDSDFSDIKGAED
jgi:hypothetical protein